ncbi:MAG: DUF2203 domain-containing protein [Planctomycetota bacterium]
MRTVTRTIFTIDEANQMLPLVASIVQDLVTEFRVLRAAGRERRALEVERSDPAGEDPRIAQLRDDVADLSSRIEGYLQELADLGVEVRDLELGLVDFPTLIDGEPAYLSWRQGEERVCWWHPADRGFSDRTPVPVPGGRSPLSA